MEKSVSISGPIIDQYEILTPLDQSADVFLVMDRESEEIFVEKIIDVLNPALYAQMKDHPCKGVPKIRRFEFEEGRMILIEEYIHGRNLMQITESGGSFTEEEVIRYMVQLCAILKQFHEMDPPVIHRDIKPGNLVLTQDENLYLIDFNIAREYNPESGLDTVALVSHHFSAPEAYGFGQSDQRSDIYSMGATMHYLLTGGYLKETAYEGPLKNVIDTCTRMDPEDRYSSVDELKDALEETVDLSEDKDSSRSPEREDADREKDVKDLANRRKESFLPPGFRSKNPVYMILGLAGYLLLFLLCFTMEIESTLKGPYAAVDLWSQRICAFLFFILTILIIFDYRGCLEKIPGIGNIRFRVFRIILSVFLVFALLLAILVLFYMFLSAISGA